MKVKDTKLSTSTQVTESLNSQGVLSSNEQLKTKKLEKNYEVNSVINESIEIKSSSLTSWNQQNSLQMMPLLVHPNVPLFQLNLTDFKFQSEQDYTSCCGEYINEIYFNLLQDEKNLKKKPIYGYMAMQDDINTQMRAILLDWLIEVHLRFRLRPQTMFQTVWIIDTYLSMKPIKRARLQLLGIAALLISCKEQEVYYPKLNEFTDITDRAYNKAELLEMEDYILKILDYDILAPTSLEFYDIIAKAFGFEKKQYYLGKYFMESSMIDDNLLKYSNSVIACACAYIVMKFFNMKNYNVLYGKNMLNEECPQKVIKDAAREICCLIKNLTRSTLYAVKEKFMLPQYEKVAELCEDQEH